MMKKNILVTYAPVDEEKQLYREILDDLSQIHYLKDESETNRSQLLQAADILIALGFSPKEIDSQEVSRLQNYPLSRAHGF